MNANDDEFHLQEKTEKYLFLGVPGKAFIDIDPLKKEDKILITNESPCHIKECEKQHSEYGEVIIVENYYNSGEVTLAAILCFERNNYIRIIISSESDVLRSASLRDHLKLDGQSLNSALAFRDKFIMKSILKKNGINTPEFCLIDSDITLIKFISEHSYPVIIKPKKGYGAVETFVLRNIFDLEKLLRKRGFLVNFKMINLIYFTQRRAGNY